MPRRVTNLRKLEIRDINDWKGAIWSKVQKSGQTTWYASLYGNILLRSTHEKALEALAIMDMRLNGPGKTAAVQEYFRKYSHTFEEAFDKYYSRVRLGYAESTLTYIRTYRLAMEPLMERRMHELTPEVVEEWLLSLRKAGKAAGTCNKYLRECRAVLKNAIRLEWLHQNPCDFVHRPKAPPKKKVPIYSTDEIANVISGFRCLTEKVIGACMFHLGLRIAECLALRVEDVDMLVGVVSVKVQCRYKSKPANVSQGTKPLKTANAERDIVMTPQLYLLMKELLANRCDESPFLFHNSVTAYSVQDWSRCWKRAHKKAGVPLRSPHVARHTVGTTALRAGVPEATVARMLGHANAIVTRRYYDHAVVADSHLAASAIGRAYEGSCDERAAAAVTPRT